MTLVVMFGLPGAGKSWVARRFSERHGYFLHEGDDDLPSDMREVIDAAQPVTEDMRDRFVDAMIREVEKHTAQHPRVVLAQTFLKQRHRERFRQRFPAARFVLVTASDETRAHRLSHRHAQPLEPAYAKAMTGLFDAPRDVDATVENDGHAIDAQLDALVKP